jgi:hypothetical protein
MAPLLLNIHLSPIFQTGASTFSCACVAEGCKNTAVNTIENKTIFLPIPDHLLCSNTGPNKKQNFICCEFDGVTLGSSAIFPRIRIYWECFESKPTILLLGQQEPTRPIAFHPHLTMGLVFSVWHLRSPDRTETAPSGARLVHFKRFVHWGTS